MRHQSQITLHRLSNVVVLACFLFGALGAGLTLLGHADILRSALCSTNTGCAGTNLGGFLGAVKDLEGPADDALAALSGLGLIAGGAMIAIAKSSGFNVLMMAGGMILVVLLGRGVVA